MKNEPFEIADAGLQPERTIFAWNRTMVSFLVVSAVFLRWRPDKPPQDCRYDQLEVTTPFELAKVFGAG